ncbi:hypothetical protein PV04_01015 [Phialophora macrospora]|uniref:Zn(2)-C6 fungal-type domain-containing protein n=1 Tax=Phialophora macrospora TaxID=1851006 RepID=A0A0D2D5H5_9EURO|nr:hypothetical protein PV04_01015 [Phialophora macrospora]
MAGQGRHAPKTRTACLTCKKRRVKCGLERPSCARCLKAGRQCDGYQLSVVEARPFPSSTQTTRPQLSGSSSLLSAFRATESEWHAYAFYTNNISGILGGAFDADLWQGLVLQVADTEPTVRHGVFALGNLFRHHGVSDSMSECVCARCRQALRHYNKAISSFSQYMQRPPNQQAIDVALLSCVIFICLESYRLNDKIAISLISRGCGMIAEAMPKGPDTPTIAIDSGLVNLFDRLWLLSSMFGHHIPRPSPRPPQTLDLGSLPPFISTIQTARDSLHEIIAVVQNLRLRVFQAQLKSTSDSERFATISALQREQQAVLLLLESWQSDLQALIDRQGLQAFRKSQAWSILTVQWLIAKISAAASMDPAERDGEDQSDDFRNLVAVAEECLARHPQANETNNFLFEPCFLPALYLTARKCRDSVIRRKALELMSRTGGKEGLWYRSELRCIAARVIELEEGLAVLDPQDQLGLVDQKPIRFYDILAELNYRRGGRTYVDVTYLMYDVDSDTRWRSVRETLTVAE